jgi:hypothetical protein
MDSFVEAQNRLKRMSYRGAVTLFKNAAKPRSSLLVHTCGHEVTGLKTYRGPKRKDQLGVQHGRGSGFAVSVVRGRSGTRRVALCAVFLHTLWSVLRAATASPASYPAHADLGRDVRASPVQIIPTVRLPPHGYTRHSMTSLPSPSCRIAATAAMFLDLEQQLRLHDHRCLDQYRKHGLADRAFL